MFNTVSIIVPTHGRPTKLARCLSALARQDMPDGVDVETIVAIDGGEGVEPDMPRETPPHTRYMRLPRVGAAAARNAAIDVARGELLLFINDDTYPHRNWIREHLRGQQLRGRPGMVLGETRWMTWPDATVLDGLLRDTSMIFFYDRMTPGALHGFRHFWTCNASAPAEQVRRIGGFEVRLRPVFFEDCELAFRLERECKVSGTHADATSGVYYHPAAVNVHDHRLTWDDYRRRESALGRMAHRLAIVNPACFEAIFGRSDIASFAESCRHWLALDARDHAAAEVELTRLLAMPLSGVADWPSLRTALYAMHLPIKRRLFREGFVAAADPARVEGDGAEGAARTDTASSF